MSVAGVDKEFEKAARAYQDTLTKPQGALGRLEDIACWFAARQKQVIPTKLKAHICVFAGDHGVVEEGVSAYPSVVTGEMVKNFVAGGAAINVLARQAGATFTIVDAGIASDISAVEGVIHAKVAGGTQNITQHAAMTEAEYQQALAVGEQQAVQAIEGGANLLIAGDMGIGNTTASACMICKYAGLNARDVVGMGTGVNDAMYQHKLSVVKKVLERIKDMPAKNIAREVGGFEIAAMEGFYRTSARLGVPVLLDGFISTAAALAAVAWNKRVVDWMLASHVSQEKGHVLALQTLGLEPLLNLQMRLGEGSGAALVLPLLQSAIALHADMATFSDAGVSDKDG
jgi:nicotinate-nucleotide--dimethylbenzimidazole phosphoribosyltransferase